jgi:monoamine oxidase
MSFPLFVDVVIVGAGAAGIGAARAAQAAGLRAVLLEASSRIGGRAYTDTSSIGLPWDHGCHWLHSASRNPLVAVAEQFGLRYERDDEVTYHHAGRWATEDESAGMLAHYSDLLHRATALGLEVDRPLSELLPGDGPWDRVIRSWIIHSFAHPLEQVSTSDVARYEATSTPEDWAVRDGYGTLFARLAHGLPIVCDAPVTQIDWGGREVVVTSTQGTLRARAAIVTASTTVLRDEVIRFDPPLPLWKREAWAAAPLGAVNKVAIRFTHDVLGDVAPNTFAFTTQLDGTAYWLRPCGQPVAISLLGGPLCLELAQAGRDECLAYVRDQLGAMFGGSVAGAIAQTGFAMWTEEPFIRGSYAGCLPGQAHRRPDLARPVGERLFFAGEATAPADFATAHGAYESGYHAVAAVQAALNT